MLDRKVGIGWPATRFFWGFMSGANFILFLEFSIHDREGWALFTLATIIFCAYSSIAAKTPLFAFDYEENRC